MVSEMMVYERSKHYWRCSVLIIGYTKTANPIKHRMNNKSKSKGIPRQAEVALGFPGRLRPRIITTFGTTWMVGRQPKAPAAFTPGEIPGTHFRGLSRPQGTWFLSEGTTEKIPSDTIRDRSLDRSASSAVP